MPDSTVTLVDRTMVTATDRVIRPYIRRTPVGYRPASGSRVGLILSGGNAVDFLR